MPSYLSYRLPEEATPMRLCLRCSGLNPDVLSTLDCRYPYQDYLKHQPTFIALEKSALDGCDMCCMFMEDAVQKVCQETDWSLGEVYQRLRGAESETQPPQSCTLRSYYNEGTLENQANATLEYIEYIILYWNSKGLLDRVPLSYKLRNCIGNKSRLIDQSELSALPNWGTARSWIRACAHKHERCPRAIDSDQKDIGFPQLPTRVIDVGLGNNEEPRLVVPGNRNDKYVTLSHCWGGVQPLKTLSSNIRAHLTALPFLSLPKTFQDAVTATRELGFQYLWIDSLCIIQDSTKDWQAECSKMAAIYRNSSLTICGPKASNSSSGFLHPRTYLHTPSRLWKFPSTTGTGCERLTISPYCSSIYYAYDEFRWLTDEERESPTEDRGWILQEYLLSPRLLFFGLHRMYWECSMSVEFEDFPLYDDPVYSETSLSPVGREIAGLHCSISKSMMSQFEAASPTESRRIWFRLIEDYSRRLLSVPNDKLPAVSAIASWLFGNNRKDYLAGLPNSALHEGLAWKTMHHVPYKGRHSGCAYRAPSWSWACTDFPVNFITSLKYMAFRNDSDHRRIRRRDDGRKIRRRDDVMSKQHKLEIHHTAIELAGSDPFGRLVSGSIKLRARTKIFRVVHKVSSSTYQVAEHISGNVIGVFYADDPLWYSSMDTATQNEDGAAEPGEGRNERPPTSGPCHDDSDFEGRNMEVKCLCIDSFDEFDWVAIVIEELPLGHTERFTNRSATPSAYRPYRRMGLVEHNPWIRGSDSEWFLDSPWELIELF